MNEANDPTNYDTYDLKFTNVNEDSNRKANKKRRLLTGGEAILKQNK